MVKISEISNYQRDNSNFPPPFLQNSTTSVKTDKIEIELAKMEISIQQVTQLVSSYLNLGMKDY